MTNMNIRQRLMVSSPSVQWLLLGTVLLFLGSFIGWSLFAEYSSVDSRERERLATQARVIDENLGRQLVATNLALDSIRGDLPYLGRQQDGKGLINRRLQAMREAMPGLRAITVFDAAGTLQARSPDQFVGQNFSSREYFQIARRGGDPAVLYVSPPFLAATGEYVINMAKVLPDERGGFGGIILASLDPEYFSVLLASVRYAQDMRASLIHADGKLFLMIPPRPGVAGIELASPGSFYTRHLESGQAATVMTGTSYATGGESMVAFRTIQPAKSQMDKPLVLGVGRDLQSIYQPWWRSVFEQGGLFVLLVLGGALWLYVYQQRQRAYNHLVLSQEALRKQAEADLRISAVAFESQEAMMVTDANNLILRVNRAFTQITGYTAEEAVGQNPRVFKSGQHDADFYSAMWESIKQTGRWQGEVWDRRKNGEIYPKWLTVSAVKDNDGIVTNYVGIHTDNTERKRVEQQLDAYQAHLEELVSQRTAELNAALVAARLADRMKDEFLANISHDLRTPLSAMIGFSSLAQPLCTDVRQREYLEKINSAGKTLSGIINDLLDLSKIAAGCMELEMKAFSLRQLVQRCNSVISYRAQEMGLQLIEQISEEIPDVLLGDSLRIEQILINLLSNAIKFTVAGRIELRIGLYAREAQRLCLDIEVEDQGIGLNQEEIDQLFQPFKQADASTTRRFGGTGLGLAICKRLTELMGGEISVRSCKGSGSIFHVRVWVGLGNADELLLAEAAHESMQVRYEDVHVLVVDDQPFNRDVVDGLLAVVGIRPYQVCNGQEALAFLADSTVAIDLVFMDIQMPVMDGLTATRMIREREAFLQLPIIAMTAHTMAHEKARSIEAGMNDHIGKPFDEAAFYGVLAKWIPRGKQHLQSVGEAHPQLANALPSIPGVDTVAGLALMVGDQARYRHWLHSFVTEAPEATRQIRLALAAGTPVPASMQAHALKGRAGLLGMNALQACAAELETTIDSAQSADELLLALEQGVAAMCAEIESKLGRVESATPVVAPLPDLPLPASVVRLLDRLQAGDSDCDLLIADCLAELENTDWAPPLRQALTHARNFDFDAARSALLGT